MKNRVIESLEEFKQDCVSNGKEFDTEKTIDWVIGLVKKTIPTYKQFYDMCGKYKMAYNEEG